MATASVPVGGEVDAWCTSCKRELNHVVVAKLAGAIKRVQCLSCKGQHNYRAAAAAVKPPARPRPRKVPLALDDPTLPARPYLTATTYVAGELILHPVYGRGQVMARRGNKIDVEFTGGAARTLLHAQA
jgi:hypothetical protein